ncbi:hypothetical protein GP486_002639 [Trichoglossum hirsutum]|uniref:Neprosin PEP catalytic domain-containing protein n=1 Tax=Trichoglossum hirsutum TaxID=265104 RepID=A0A9P8LDX6_9PEZI|nr:hypothetical protein GP486_002639 [Trichoglossum hirsutum]
MRVQKPMGVTQYPGNNESFIPFRDFIKQVERAKYKDYEHTNVRSRKDFQDMRGHILRMYESVRKAESFVLGGKGNEHADCIGIKEQPTVHQLKLREIAKPPKDPTKAPETQGPRPGNTSYADSPLKLGRVDKSGHPISCPANTIPMARMTLEKLTTFPTLSDFFEKVPRGAKVPRESKAPGFKSVWEDSLHAYGYQYANNFGGNSWLNLWDPEGDFSLSQHWYTGGSGCDLQTVEGGWIRCPSCGSSSDESVLFIYWTNHGYGRGECSTSSIVGCYDLTCPGFVQINNNWLLGGPWDQYSTAGGEQWGFELQWKLYSGNWWLFLKGRGEYEAVGYYPTSIFNGGSLSRGATAIVYGGEVARNGRDAWPQMGSGKLAAAGWQEAAFQETIFWIASDENDGVGVWASLTSSDEALERCYTIKVANFPNGGGWGTYSYFGGPGGDVCR